MISGVLYVLWRDLFSTLSIVVSSPHCIETVCQLTYWVLDRVVGVDAAAARGGVVGEGADGGVLALVDAHSVLSPFV